MGHSKAKEDTLQMTPITKEQAIANARSLIGKQVDRYIHLRPSKGYSCVPFIAEVFGYTEELPPDWLDGTPEQLAKIAGCAYKPGVTPGIGNIAFFSLDGRYHIGFMVEENSMIHAGYKQVIEVDIERFMKYYEGEVDLCRYYCHQ